MTKKYETYKVGSKVWAISAIYKDGEPTDYVAIYEAIVRTVYIELDEKTGKEKFDYWLMTPDGQEWGAEVSADQVSDDFNELVERMKPIWKNNSNTHGDKEK